ncbi:dipeptide/oligopeptide/nickel ABC transporter ATP-binding protein [Ruicaihuangia caeni]|uniref:dipeptide/oligopeptide/nickel ABC transporter ATP-binding protein n=1 Tax=Ruicaihuangia caeni TaxID=3042517 RepID=UPI00338FAEA3
MPQPSALPAPAPAPAPPVIEVTDLALRYPGQSTLAVTGVTFSVPRGQTLAIVGEAGCGKTTLARALAGRAGLRKSSSPLVDGGSLRVAGHSRPKPGRRERARWQFDVGYLAQDAGERLHPRLTIAENVAEPIYLRDQKFDRREAGAAVAGLLDRLHLPLGFMDRFPHELSRGQRQRVALARALVLEPKVLVADDPTMGVDAIVRGPLLDSIRELRLDREFTAVVIAHDLPEVRRFTSRVAIMQGGAIVGLGNVDEVLDQPLHPYVRKLGEVAR